MRRRPHRALLCEPRPARRVAAPGPAARWQRRLRRRVPPHPSVMTDDYDEFALLKDNAEEAGLPWLVTAEVTRRFVDVGEGRRISGLRWGTGAGDLAIQ